MGSTPTSNYHGFKLTQRLKQLRTAAGIDQAEFGSLLKFTLQKVSRIENGQLPGYHELRAMLDVLNVPLPQWESYIHLWQQASARPWWRPYRLKDPTYISMEHAAAHVIEYQLGHIPALLQTEDYARAILIANGEVDDRQLDRYVTVRMRQQQRLSTGLAFTAFIHEPVLHHAVDRRQLEHLLTCARLPNVCLQIVPHHGRPHAGLFGSLTLLSFDDADQPDIAFTETLLGRQLIQDPEDVALIALGLAQIADRAMPRDQSIAFLENTLRKDTA